MLDESAMVTAARRSKQVKTTNEDTEIVWDAFHEGCLD
jgi:hypothetical protein